MTQLHALKQAGLFDVNAPRYTSYPTATQFSPEIGAQDYASWLGDLPPANPVSLYVHIPFCERLCWYCACRTQGVRSLSPVRAYVDVLLQEISTLRRYLPAGLRASRLHFGGGSPTILPPEEVARLVDALTTLVPLTDGAEFSVEIDPSAIDTARMDAFVAAGMNRASIGVQDFAPQVQKAIGRLQSYEITKKTVDALRARGVNSINVDLVYGLPFQDWAALEATLEQTLGLSPDRLALFGYAHVPWMAKRQKMIPEAALPGAHERFFLAQNGAAKLVQSGLRPIGIDHFAKASDALSHAQAKGTLRRNFQGYTDESAASLIGIGASSISQLPRGYVQNAAATAQYNAAISTGKLAASRGIKLGLDDQVRATAIEMLMCEFKLDLGRLEARFGAFMLPLLKIAQTAACRFSGFCTFDGETLTILPEGLALTRMIAQMFDAYAVDQARHSSAI
ncbi:MAG: oxygen-independent coproporphyrinogen III oxidase [Paracoccaceae bacterium]